MHAGLLTVPDSGQLQPPGHGVCRCDQGAYKLIPKLIHPLMRQCQYGSAELEIRLGGVDTQAVRTPARQRPEALRAARRQPQEGGGGLPSGGAEGKFRSAFEPVAQQAPPPGFEGRLEVREPLLAASCPGRASLMAVPTFYQVSHMVHSTAYALPCRITDAWTGRAASDTLSRMARHAPQGQLTGTAAPLQRPKASRGALPFPPPLYVVPSAASGCVRTSSSPNPPLSFPRTLNTSWRARSAGNRGA